MPITLHTPLQRSDMFMETILSNSCTPAECYVYRKPACQTIILHRRAMSIETRLSNSCTPEECYVYRKPDCQTIILHRRAMSIETRLSNSCTPEECYVYRKPDWKALALQRSAMCPKSRTAPTEGRHVQDICYKHITVLSRLKLWVKLANRRSARTEEIWSL